MTFDWKPLLLLVVMMALGGLAFWFYGIAEEQRQRADTAERNLKLANDAITDMQTRQRDVAALDAKYTKELADANAENDRLRADVVAGKRRLQIAATCSKDGASATSGVVDGSSPRLTEDAELNYWRLRDGIATVTKQLTATRS